MELKISNIEAGLRPESFLTQEGYFELGMNDKNDVIEQHDKVSKNGKPYSQFSLTLLGVKGEWVGDYKINFLFDRDLKELAEAWGSDTAAWKGKAILLNAKKEGIYTRWIIKPAPLPVN